MPALLLPLGPPLPFLGGFHPVASSGVLAQSCLAQAEVSAVATDLDASPTGLHAPL
jgi:hypothetical protein